MTESPPDFTDKRVWNCCVEARVCVCVCVRVCQARAHPTPFQKGGERRLSTTEFQPDLYRPRACVELFRKRVCVRVCVRVQACATRSPLFTWRAKAVDDSSTRS
jgi:hypothetical protein